MGEKKRLINGIMRESDKSENERENYKWEIERA